MPGLGRDCRVRAATIARFAGQAILGDFQRDDLAHISNELEEISQGPGHADSWLTTCSKLGVRVALKPVTVSTDCSQASSLKQAGVSFIDTLTGASRDAVQAPIFDGSNSEEQPNGGSDSCNQDQANDSHSPVSQGETGKTSQPQASARAMTGIVNLSEVAQDSITGGTTSKASASCQERSATSQSKAAQDEGSQSSNSIRSAADQSPSLQIVAVLPSINLSEITGNDFASERGTPFGKSPELETSPADLQLFKSTALQVEQTQSETPPTVQALGSENSSDASATAKVLAAAFTLQVNLAATNPSAQGVTLTKSDHSSNSTEAANQSKSGGTAFAANLANTSSSGAPGAAKSSGLQDVSSVQHAGQSSGQTSEQAQAGTSQTTQVAARPSDAIATQTIAFATHVTSEASSTTRGTSGSTSEAPLHAQGAGELPADQSENAGVGGSGGINTARLIQSISESEMRLGMHSPEFGDISIRTSVSQQQVQAQINTDHGELGDAISAHIPLLQTRLGNDFGLQTSIEVNQLGGSHNGGQGQPSQQNHNWSSNRNTSGGVAPAMETDSQTLPVPLLLVDESRLDIRV